MPTPFESPWMPPLPALLAKHLGPAAVRVLDAVLPRRPTLRFVAGANTTVTAVDDPETETTTVTVASTGGAAPGGAVGDLQRHGPGETLVGMTGTLGQVVTWGPNGAEFSDEYAEVPDGAEGDLVGLDANGKLANVTPAGIAEEDLLIRRGGKFVRLPIGPEGAILKVVGGKLTYVSANSFDSATLAFTGYWKGSYSGVPWVSSASAGPSNARELVAPAAAPTAGAAVNGLTPAVLNGTTQYLEGALLASDYVAANAYSILMLVEVTGTPAAPNATYPFEDKQLVCVGGGGYAIAGISCTTSGIRAWHETASGAAWPATAHIALPPGKHLVALTYNGTTQSLSVDGGPPVTQDIGNVVDLTQPGAVFRVGTSYNASKFLGMTVLETRTAKVDLSAQLGNMKAELNARWGLAL